MDCTSQTDLLAGLTVVRTLGTVSCPVKRSDAVAGIRGLVLWERNSDGPIDYEAPNHHTLSVYQGGGTQTWSCERRAWGFADAVCLLPEGFDARWKHTGFVRNLHLYFTAADLEALNWSQAGAPEPIIFGRDRLLRRVSAALVHDLDWTAPGDRLALDSLVLAMLSQMSRAEATTARSLPTRSLARLEARMRDLDAGVPSLAALAAEAEMSPRHLTRLYRATTGQTLSQRQREIQVERACALLGGSASLSAIALACGFGSQSHFTRAFRTATGTTPAAWRRARS